ncbi:MAG: sugar transferase [Spirochaetia bacterium]|nr:sugar transferase [Spirochaetia bacterium]
MKRFFDIIFSLIVLILFSPFGIIIVLILKFTGEGEILYKQSRMGQNSEQFGIFKFVTMVKDSPNLGAGDITLKDDPRVLPFGKFLRKTKLNEFPQFLNVLIGEMSFVGPRPLVINQYDMIPENFQQKIKLLKPGITGIGSIIFRDEERYLEDNKENSNEFYKTEIVPFKASLECWYEDNMSFFIDSLLILTTIIMVFSPDTKLYKYLFSELPQHEIFNP